MPAASFDVDGICTPVCIFKADSFNVCLLALTLLHGLYTPNGSSAAQYLFFKPKEEETLQNLAHSKDKNHVKQSTLYKIHHIFYGLEILSQSECKNFMQTPHTLTLAPLHPLWSNKCINNRGAFHYMNELCQPYT